MMNIKKEIAVVYYNDKLLQIFSECAKQGLEVFNDYLLQYIKNYYYNKCYKGMYILSVNKLLQRSMVQMGDFLRDGTELASVAARVEVTSVYTEEGKVIVAYVQEVNQSNSNTMKLVVCKGVGEYDMMRVFMTIENAYAERFQFTTGQVIVAIVQETMYRDDVIHVIAHPYVPLTNSYVYLIDFAELPESEQLNALHKQIRTLRTKINMHPPNRYYGVMTMICRDFNTEALAKNGTPIEDHSFARHSIFELTPLTLFTGIVYPSSIAYSDPRTLRINSLQGLLSIIHNVAGHMQVVDLLVSSSKSDRDLAALSKYINAVL